MQISKFFKRDGLVNKYTSRDHLLLALNFLLNLPLALTERLLTYCQLVNW
jgi:hypothetical protein